MKTWTLALLVGLTSCKEHFIINESKEDTQRVRASSEQNEKCLFKMPTIGDSNDEDKFCTEYEGSATTGFTWEQDIDDLDKETLDGTYGLNHIIYFKYDIYATISFVLNRLFKAEITFDIQETELSHKTGFTYYIYANDLCMNIKSEITDFEYVTQITTAYIECYKNHIGSLDDFGQFAASDESDSKKPYSPYSKFFDNCELSSESTTTVKSFQPFNRDLTAKDWFNDLVGYNEWYTLIYWIGSSTNDAACYPGNLIRAIHKFEV